MFDEPVTPSRLEQWRRSIIMLTPRQPSGLDREAAIALLEELQRLQGVDRRLTELLDELRALLAQPIGRTGDRPGGAATGRGPVPASRGSGSGYRPGRHRRIAVTIKA